MSATSINNPPLAPPWDKELRALFANSNNPIISVFRDQSPENGIGIFYGFIKHIPKKNSFHHNYKDSQQNHFIWMVSTQNNPGFGWCVFGNRFIPPGSIKVIVLQAFRMNIKIKMALALSDFVGSAIQFIRFPLGGIVEDIFFDMVQFRFVSDDMFPIIALP